MSVDCLLCSFLDFINNTSYFNSYTKSITEDNYGNPNTFPTSSNGGNIGISMSDGLDCKIINNISVIDSRLSKSAIAVKNGSTAANAEIKNNLIYGTTLQGVTGTINENATTSGLQTNSIKADPLFRDPLNFDFRLKVISPAINSADNTEAPTTDFNQASRYGIADRGAIEFDANVTLWQGNTNSDWSLASNWSNGVPDNTYATNIPSGLTYYPIISSTNKQIKDICISAGGTLEIAATGSLTIDRDLVQDGAFTIKSDATNNGSLVLKGSFSGDQKVGYQRYVTTNWHLVSSPVKDQNINSFKNDLVKNGVNYAITPYKNDLAYLSRYKYYTDNTGTNNIDAATTFTMGNGYSIKKAAAGTLNFLGNLKTDDTSVTLTDNSSGVGNKWNLVGNPSTAYIALNSDADATNNLLTVNAANLDPARVAVYMWNGTSYDIINHSTGNAKFAAPGQGFFVESKNGGTSLSITEAMQSNQPGKPFYKSENNIPEIKLSLTNGEITKVTKIKYLKNTTTGLDIGYDAGTFSVESTSFNVYSHLISNSNGTDFTLQCLPNSGYENMVIPVGVNANSETEIIFTSKSLNLPTGLKVYLEDKVANTYIRLDEVNSEYKIKLDADVNGIGRFFLHTTSNALSLYNTSNFKNVSIYSLNKETLRPMRISDEIKNVFSKDIP